MKRPYFQKKTGVNQDILNIDDIRNIGFSLEKLWWAEATGGNPDGTLYVRSAESITSATVAEDSQTTQATTGTWTVKNMLLRNYGLNIYAACAFTGVANEIVFLTSNNGGLSFSGISFVRNDMELYDLFLQELNGIVMLYHSGDISFERIGVGTFYDSLALTDENWMYPGIVKDDLYYFVIYDGSNYKKYSFGISPGIVLLETFTGITTPFSFNFKRQQYYLIGNIEILIDNTHFWWRDPVNHVWQSYSVPVATDTIAMIWAHNHLNEYFIPFSIWDRYIIEITDKGVLKKIQAIEPRDYKKVYLTNINENLVGVVQFQDRNGNDDLSAWTDSSGADCTVSVVPLVDGHEDVMELDDQSGVNIALIELNFGNQISGTFELFFRSTNTGLSQSIYLHEGANNRFRFQIISDKLQWYRQSDTSWQDLANVVDDIWYHLKVDFDCTSDTLDVWLDGTSVGTDLPFRFGATNLSVIALFTQAGNSGYQLYIDVIGFSWESYVSGSNKKINAFVGYGSEIGEAWFSTGDPDTSIMQLSFKDYSSGTVKSLVVSEIYKAPEHTLIRRTKPFEDEWIDEYTDAEVLFYGGKVKDNDSDNRFMYIYLMKSWQDENEETKVIANLSQYTHKEMLEYVLDNFSRYRKYGPGTNADVNEFTPDQISGVDADWSNLDGAGCESSYVVKKGFLNGFLYNIMQQFDNGAGACYVDYSISGITIFSGKFVTSDITKEIKIEFHEGGSRIGLININSSKIQWYSGSFHTILDPAINNTIYHWVLVFSAIDDDVDIYLNGVFIFTKSLENNITTEITKISFETHSGTIGPTVYHSNLYTGNSLVDAMHTFSSISPLLTTKHDFNLIDYSIPNIYKLIVEETGYIVSERPDGLVYVDQYAPSGKTINMNESQGITFMGRLKQRNEKFSLITFYGGFINGKPIFSQGFGEPNFGTHEDWFPTIDGRDPGDIYYDADGNPKSHRLDAMVATALINRNIVVKKVTMGKRFVGMFNPGTSLTYNNEHYKISMEKWYAWRRNTYNGITDDNRVEIADSLLSPTKGDPEDTPIDQANANIATNSDNIVKVEQSVGYLAERVRSRDVLTVYIEENQRNLNENIWGFYNTIGLNQTLNSGSPINATVGCHRILFIVNAGGDVSGTINITGTTRDRTDTSQSTPADTEVITIDSLSIDNSSSDTEGNLIHEFDNVFISDKWFEGAIVISTTNLTITDIDVIAILYHQFDSFKLITLKTFDFTGKVTNASGWFYAYLYAITTVNSAKKYDITKIVGHEIPSALTVANKGYRRRKIIDQLIDGSAGDGIWAEIFFGPAAATYWNDISLYLTALLDDGAN